MQYPSPSEDISSSIVQDTREMNVMFVHSEIDELGLTAPQFRIYAHLCRRASGGLAYPGIDSMAKICLLSKPTVLAAINHLEAIGMIRITKVNGCRNNYTLTGKSQWKPLPKIYRSNLDTGKKEVTHQSNIGNATGKKEVTKGNPYKVIHKGNPDNVVFSLNSETETKVQKSKGSLEELKTYALELGLPESDGEYMFDTWESNGWMRGKIKIKDWKAAFRTWRQSGWLPSQKQVQNGNGYRQTSFPKAQEVM